MRFSTAARMRAQQPSMVKRDRAESWNIRWAYNTKRLLTLPVRLARIMLEELGEEMEKRSRAREADKLQKYKPLKLRASRRSAQAKSSLLNLPVEIRTMIWEYVVAGKFIVLYRKDGHITSSVLDRNGTTSSTNAALSIMRSVATPRAKAGIVSLLQTCQTTYLETITMLYQDNTFACPDSGVLVDLCRERCRFNMSLIRSLHYSIGTQKFLVDEATPSEHEMMPSPDVDAWGSVSKVFHTCFPSLQNLSIFLYGTLHDDENYTGMLEPLHNVYQQGISITIKALEMPEAYFIRTAAFPFDMSRTPRARVLEGSKRPTYAIAYPSPVNFDDTPVENGTWRVGRLWLRPCDEAEAAKVLVYAVLIPEDEEVWAVRKSEPALLWDIIPASADGLSVHEL